MTAFLVKLVCLIVLIRESTCWSVSGLQKWGARECSVGVTTTVLLGSGPSLCEARDQFQLPPIDRNDKTRCTITSSTIGQANAGRDKLLDLRECNVAGQSAEGKDLSGMIALGADFSGMNFRDAQISKAFARNAKFVGCGK